MIFPFLASQKDVSYNIVTIQIRVFLRWSVMACEEKSAPRLTDQKIKKKTFRHVKGSSYFKCASISRSPLQYAVIHKRCRGFDSFRHVKGSSYFKCASISRSPLQYAVIHKRCRGFDFFKKISSIIATGFKGVYHFELLSIAPWDITPVHHKYICLEKRQSKIDFMLLQILLLQSVVNSKL